MISICSKLLPNIKFSHAQSSKQTQTRCAIISNNVKFVTLSGFSLCEDILICKCVYVCVCVCVCVCMCINVLTVVDRKSRWAESMSNGAIYFTMHPVTVQDAASL